MAKIVEFVGTPGVGKTTIYKEMITRSNKKHKWIPGEFLFPKEKLTAEHYGTFILNFLKHITGRKGVDIMAMEEAGGRFVALYPEYIDQCWNNINCLHKKNINGLDLRFQKVSYLYKLIQKIQTLRETESNQIAIVDEGLIHLITNSLCKREDLAEEQKEIENFLQIMPVPNGIVSIETDLEENTKRLLQRKKVIPMHKLLKKSQLEKVISIDHKKRAAVNSILETQNIPLLRINSTDKVAINVSKIINFVENL